MRSFESFGVDDWTEWFDGVFAGRAVSPPPPHSGREIGQDLLALFRTLNDPSAAAFASAVGILVRATQLVDRAAARLFTLLQMAATVKPRGLEQYLDQLLRSDVCRQLRYGRADLHSDVLSTLSRYGVDDRLVDYIEVSVSNTAAFEYALNGFRIAGLLNASAASRIAPFVADLVLAEDSDTRLRQFAVQLLDLAFRHKYRSFLQFFLDFSERESVPRIEVVAHGVLLSGCTEEETTLSTIRALQSVIHYCATAAVSRLPLRLVLEIAKSHRSIERPLVHRALDHCWRSSARYVHGPVPWEYVSSNEDYAPERLMKKVDILFNTEGESLEFDGSEDPAVIDILSDLSRRRRHEARELVAV